MSILCIKGLCHDNILDMELEPLADMFLMDFSNILDENKAKSFRLDDFIGIIIPDGSDIDVKRAISEAFQWLYNNGYIARQLWPENSQRYFITRTGKERLSEVYREVLEEVVISDGEIPGPPNSGNSEDY